MWRNRYNKYNDQYDIEGRRPCWGYPKGKINEDELETECAAREVLEETGVSIGPLIKEDDWLEEVVCDQSIKLYIVPGVRENIRYEF